ncbi:ATP-binding protein [Uliginosibacterium sp. H1]|uniref:ATP-binding protein n=1 Tax=Uliginosibacterium sp. H1 TaxID=3114757 RepID=UPI002E19C8FD|nr:ATP-binding protein [Uliginosibacterium sp. H1]
MSAAAPRTAQGEATQAADTLAGRSNLLQLIQLRWLAVGGQLLTIIAVHVVLGIDLPLGAMLSTLGVLALFNAACWLRSRSASHIGDRELLAGLLVDVGVLSAQLYYSGGITNPFIFLYLLQVAVASVLLRPHHTWTIVGVTGLCFAALTQWYQPLPEPEIQNGAVSTHYAGGLLLCFLLNAALLTIFLVRIGRNLRARDARLADLRQRAAEEEHIVRMGLLATGAAHELGTPLATLSVILGDWTRMAPFAGEPELREEMEEMQLQLQRCKTIVSGILLSAGEARGEAPVVTTLHAFLDELVAHWRRTRNAVFGLNYDRSNTPDFPMISDFALRQMIDNIVDNALDASPHAAPSLLAHCEGDELVLRVLDEGPGFAPAMLERFGKPYQSSKGRPGGGLGLFLAVNVVRALGGSIAARNRNVGGAEVEVRLPLAALAPPHEDDADDHR